MLSIRSEAKGRTSVCQDARDKPVKVDKSSIRVTPTEQENLSTGHCFKFQDLGQTSTVRLELPANRVGECPCLLLLSITEDSSVGFTILLLKSG